MVPSRTLRPMGVNGLLDFFQLLHTGGSVTWLASLACIGGWSKIPLLHVVTFQHLATFDGDPGKLSQHEWRTLMKITPSCIHSLICSTCIYRASQVPGIVLETRDTAWPRHTWPLPVMYMLTMEKTLLIYSYYWKGSAKTYESKILLCGICDYNFRLYLNRLIFSCGLNKLSVFLYLVWFLFFAFWSLSIVPAQLVAFLFKFSNLNVAFLS